MTRAVVISTFVVFHNKTIEVDMVRIHVSSMFNGTTWIVRYNEFYQSIICDLGSDFLMKVINLAQLKI